MDWEDLALVSGQVNTRREVKKTREAIEQQNELLKKQSNNSFFGDPKDHENAKEKYKKQKLILSLADKLDTIIQQNEMIIDLLDSNGVYKEKNNFSEKILLEREEKKKKLEDIKLPWVICPECGNKSTIEVLTWCSQCHHYFKEEAEEWAKINEKKREEEKQERIQEYRKNKEMLKLQLVQEETQEEEQEYEKHEPVPDEVQNELEEKQYGAKEDFQGKLCPNCGEKNDQDGIFCVECGTKL